MSADSRTGAVQGHEACARGHRMSLSYQMLTYTTVMQYLPILQCCMCCCNRSSLMYTPKRSRRETIHAGRKHQVHQKVLLFCSVAYPIRAHVAWGSCVDRTLTSPHQRALSCQSSATDSRVYRWAQTERQPCMLHLLKVHVIGSK